MTESSTLAGPCPVCRVPALVECRALDHGPLPGGHAERNAGTPLFDLTATVVSLRGVA